MKLMHNALCKKVLTPQADGGNIEKVKVLEILKNNINEHFLANLQRDQYKELFPMPYPKQVKV